MSTSTVHSAMQNNQHGALRGVAIVLGGLVYLAGLIYAGVRSYDLFARTVPPDLLALAVLGILALELSALGLPLAVHYWTAPGPQRLAALAFYVVDLVLIAANAILDAAQQSGTVLPGFLDAYGTFAVPALPVLCMIGWALLYALDPSSKERDMRAAVQAATQEAMMGQMIEAAKSLDITDAVQRAAEAAAKSLVVETLGRAPGAAPGGAGIRPGAPQALPTAAIAPAQDAPTASADDLAVMRALLEQMAAERQAELVMRPRVPANGSGHSNGAPPGK